MSTRSQITENLGSFPFPGILGINIMLCCNIINFYCLLQDLVARHGLATLLMHLQIASIRTWHISLKSIPDHLACLRFVQEPINQTTIHSLKSRDAPSFKQDHFTISSNQPFTVSDRSWLPHHEPGSYRCEVDEYRLRIIFFHCSVPTTEVENTI